MSPKVDSDLPPQLRSEMLEEIRTYLPAFLHKGATEQHDPVGDVKELLNLDEEDLRRVIAVHACLDQAVLTFGRKLREGLRSPLTSSFRPAEVGQAVRGPVDWSATVARRSLEAGNRVQYVVRSARRALDVPENRALAWLLERLASGVRRALRETVDSKALDRSPDLSKWANRIRLLAAQVEAARRTDWLQKIEPEIPSRDTLRRLRAARSRFYAQHVSAAARVMLSLDDPREEELARLLCQRYFEPAPTWLVYEVCVALRLARAFAEASDTRRRTRLLVGSGRAAFARYGFSDGSEVSLIYQAWPEEASRSLLRAASERQQLKPTGSRPDIVIVRTGPDPDIAIVELKASHRSTYLGEGLAQLLCYVADRPGLWRRKPGGWLVALPSKAFADADPDEEADLWIVSADRVAEAAVARFAPAAAG